MRIEVICTGDEVLTGARLSDKDWNQGCRINY
jgi:molybdopterin-biosynthesis enzyme MoeA-like protein